MKDILYPKLCQQCDDEGCDGPTFFCSGCGKWVSWDKGVADDMPELCDDCWCHVTARREEASEINGQQRNR
jgi:hypothetical protein